MCSSSGGGAELSTFEGRSKGATFGHIMSLIGPFEDWCALKNKGANGGSVIGLIGQISDLK